jgi:hypothetical protein
MDDVIDKQTTVPARKDGSRGTGGFAMPFKSRLLTHAVFDQQPFIRKDLTELSPAC